MNEPMGNERLAEIRTAVEGYRGTSLIRLRPGSAHAHREALLAEVDRLRARIAGLGEIHEEWSVRWNEVGDTSEKHHTEAEARQRAKANPKTMTLVRRFVGEWQDVGDRATGGVVSGDALPVDESGCTYTMPISAVEIKRDGRVQIRRRTPEETRAYLEEHRDEQVASGVAAEVIDVLIEAAHESEEPS